MTVNPVQNIIAIVLVENSIDQNLHRCQKDHENGEVCILVGDGATEATVKHIGEQDQESNQRSVEESL